jgi:hypothetical protein
MKQRQASPFPKRRMTGESTSRERCMHMTSGGVSAGKKEAEAAKKFITIAGTLMHPAIGHFVGVLLRALVTRLRRGNEAGGAI